MSFEGEPSMPVTIHHHLSIPRNRSLLILLADTPLEQSDCEDKLLVYGSIECIDYSSDKRVAFVYFECEHAPLLVARCFILHKHNSEVPIPKGVHTILPGCSINNFLFVQHVPSLLSTTVIENHFSRWSHSPVVVYRPISFRGEANERPSSKLVVKFRRRAASDYYNQQRMKNMLHITNIKVRGINHQIHAVPQLDVLINSRNVCTSDGCDECNVKALRPSIELEEREDRALINKPQIDCNDYGSARVPIAYYPAKSIEAEKRGVGIVEEKQVHLPHSVSLRCPTVIPTKSVESSPSIVHSSPFYSNPFLDPSLPRFHDVNEYVVDSSAVGWTGGREEKCNLPTHTPTPPDSSQPTTNFNASITDEAPILPSVASPRDKFLSISVDGYEPQLQYPPRRLEKPLMRGMEKREESHPYSKMQFSRPAPRHYQLTAKRTPANDKNDGDHVEDGREEDRDSDDLLSGEEDQWISVGRYSATRDSPGIYPIHDEKVKEEDVIVFDMAAGDAPQSMMEEEGGDRDIVENKDEDIDTPIDRTDTVSSGSYEGTVNNTDEGNCLSNVSMAMVGKSEDGGFFIDRDESDEEDEKLYALRQRLSAIGEDDEDDASSVELSQDALVSQQNLLTDKVIKDENVMKENRKNKIFNGVKEIIDEEEGEQGDIPLVSLPFLSMTRSEPDSDDDEEMREEGNEEKEKALLRDALNSSFAPIRRWSRLNVVDQEEEEEEEYRSTKSEYHKWLTREETMHRGDSPTEPSWEAEAQIVPLPSSLTAITWGEGIVIEKDTEEDTVKL